MSFSKRLKQQLRSGLSVLRRDRPAVLGFLFHGLFEDDREIDAHHLDAQQGITLAHMRRFIEEFLEAGYRFTSPEQSDRGLAPDGLYAWITFDDGYANNLRMLPLLEEYDIPATFYITTGNVEQQECFWWDVVYRERIRRGAQKTEISREQKMLKDKHHLDIVTYLIEKFGDNCLNPWSDTDRPMTIAELQEFASHSLVYIGNHTRNHYLLDRYTDTEVLEQIQLAQNDISQWTGRKPISIAYPNGNFSGQALSAARASGLACGLTLLKHKNHPPLAGNYELGRFTLWGNQDIHTQCNIFRSDIPL
ncbi:polysaccharide deacetylase family protein [Thiolapillus sp.]